MKMASSRTSSDNFFNLFITGQIESATFPLGPDASEIFCRYEIIAGADWELVSGIKSGVTQSAANRNGFSSDKVVFNMPIELTFKSTNPFGWPQILLVIYGKTCWGSDTVLGYSRIHLPLFGAEPKRLHASILIPKCSNMISELSSWITGRNPELRDPKILLESSKSKGLNVESYGEVNLIMNTVARGVNRLGFDKG